jgi:hypothetical protein
MGYFFASIIVIIIFAIIIGTIRSKSIPFEVSLSQTKEWRNKYVYCTAEIFIDKFKEHKWSTDNLYCSSLFGINNRDNYIHAGILGIDGIGYLPLDTKEYDKIMVFIKKYIDSYNFMKECNVRMEEE